MVNRYGIIPNGGRVYYLNRSQPPLLTPMIYEYFKATNDSDFIRENIALLEKEYQWWMENRIVEVFLPSEDRLCFHRRLSFCSRGGGCFPACTGTDTPPGRQPPGRPPPPGGHCSGQYASYWNAFLCILFMNYN